MKCITATTIAAIHAIDDERLEYKEIDNEPETFDEATGEERRQGGDAA